jgi:hypothetical protein
LTDQLKESRDENATVNEDNGKQSEVRSQDFNDFLQRLGKLEQSILEKVDARLGTFYSMTKSFRNFIYHNGTLISILFGSNEIMYIVETPFNEE